MPPTNDLSGTINFSNVKAYFKPGSRTEFLEDFSEILVFDPSSPLKIVSSPAFGGAIHRWKYSNESDGRGIQVHRAQ